MPPAMLICRPVSSAIGVEPTATTPLTAASTPDELAAVSEPVAKYSAVAVVMSLPMNPNSTVAIPEAGRLMLTELTLHPVNSSDCAMSENQCSIENDLSVWELVGT